MSDHQAAEDERVERGLRAAHNIEKLLTETNALLKKYGPALEHLRQHGLAGVRAAAGQRKSALDYVGEALVGGQLGDLLGTLGPKPRRLNPSRRRRSRRHDEDE